MKYNEDEFESFASISPGEVNFINHDETRGRQKGVVLQIMQEAKPTSHLPVFNLRSSSDIIKNTRRIFVGYQ